MSKVFVLILASFVASTMAADKFVGGPIVGGFSPTDVNSEEIKEIASFATSEVALKTNTGPLELVRIVSAETQVVAGLNYKLKLEFKRKNSAGGSIACDVVIFDQSWTNTRKLTESRCAPVLTKF